MILFYGDQPHDFCLVDPKNRSEGEIIHNN